MNRIAIKKVGGRGTVIKISFDFIAESLTIAINNCLTRSSHRRCSIKKAVLKNFAIFTGKHLRWSFFLIKLV